MMKMVRIAAALFLFVAPASAQVVNTGTPVGANPSATAGPAAVNGTAPTFMTSDSAPAIQLGTSGQKGLLQGDGSTLTISSGVISCTTSTTSQLGCVKPDGTTITISGGTISSTGGGTPCTTTASSLQYDAAGSFGCVSGWTSAGTNLAATGTLTMTNTTDSSSVSTGSINTAGGVGIAKNIHLSDSTSSVGMIKWDTNTLISDAYGNVFWGDSAGNNTVTSSFNVAIGRQAGGSLSTGTGQTVGIGTNANASNTTGAYNVAVGSFTLYANQTAPGNVALGSATLYTLNGGSGYNLGIGTNTFYSLGSGAYNVGIGYRAGYNYTGTETGNLIFGYTLGTAGENDTIQFGTGDAGGIGLALDYAHTTAGVWTFAAKIAVPGGSTPVITTTSNITSGAGSSAGTLTNAPAIGNPTKWFPINDNGTTRYVPAW